MTPDDGDTVTRSPLGMISTDSDTAHYVQIVAFGPIGPGAYATVDYMLNLTIDTFAGSGSSATNQQIGLAPSGTWTNYALQHHSEFVSAGGHSAVATAWIQLAGNTGSRASASHTHAITAL